jgi:phosphopantetheine adenylyltransferase
MDESNARAIHKRALRQPVRQQYMLCFMASGSAMRILIETGKRSKRVMVKELAKVDRATKGGGTATPVELGLISRVVQGVKYMISGVGPSTWFGPQQPIAPISQESKGRTWDYPVGYNLQITKRPYEATTFDQMRQLADNYDLLRLIIETRKDQIAKMQWRIKPRDMDGAKPDKGTVKKLAPQIKAIKDFLIYPDREHDWDTWLRMLLEDLFVIDAPTIYPRMTKGGGIYSLDVFDGSTILRKLNADGRTPEPLDTAYQQLIKGVPMADFSRDELIYRPRNVRSAKAYGFSPVEQVIVTVNIALRRQLFQLSYYTEGNVPEALIGVPETWTTDQIALFQAYWDDLMEGNLAQRRHAKFVPSGVKLMDAKEHALKDDYDEWLARILCFCFSINPQPFVKMMNRATSETIQQATMEEGLHPILSWIKSMMNYVLWKYFQAPELEFDFETGEEVDPAIEAEIINTKVRAGALSIDEWRSKDGLDPLPDGLGKEYLIYTASGATPLEKVLNPPEPVAPPPIPSKDENAPPPPPPGKGKDAEKLEKGKKKLNRIDRERESVTDARSKMKKLMMKAFKMGKTEAMKLATDDFMKDAEESAQHAKRLLAKLDLEGWAFLMDPSEELMAAITKDGAYQALMQIGLTEENMTDKMSELAVKYARDRAAEMVGKKWVEGDLIDNPNAKWQITESTRDMLRSDITKAIEEGWSPGKLKSAIADNYAFSKDRADTIARTEIGNADIQGNMIAYKESGIVEGKEWVLGSEHDDDDECDMNADAGVIPLDEPFPSGDMEPLAHPRCVCDLMPAVMEEAA